MVESDEEITPRQIVEWIKQHLRRTFFPTLSLIFPSKTINPLTFLGMLTFICFTILGITGVLLQVYYQPDFAGSYGSVDKITSEIPYGFEIRNIHYYASHLMVLLAVAHFYYIFFTRRYKFHNELLWLIGIVLGLLTVAEAYTGYVLIMNTRAMFAVNIGSGLLSSISTSLSNLLVGYSYTDLVLRMYTLHTVAIPAIIILLIPLHFPRALTMDFPSIIGLAGVILVAAGLAPSELGSKFMPGAPSEITIPEWYLTGIYALLRTGFSVFVAGVLVPFMFVFIFALIPFYDRESGNRFLNRQFYVALGLASLLHITLVTIWGFRGGDLFHPITSEADLAIDPFVFYGSLSALFVFALGLLHLLTRTRRLPLRPKEPGGEGMSMVHRINSSLTLALMVIVVAFQIVVSVQAFYIRPQGLRELAMIWSGLTIMSFAAATYIYRVCNWR